MIMLDYEAKRLSFNKTAFVERLKKARKAAGQTTEQLANYCGLSPTYIRHIEAGDKMPSLNALIELCNSLEISPFFLLQDSIGKTELEEVDELTKRAIGLDTEQLKMVTDVVDAIIKNF